MARNIDTDELTSEQKKAILDERAAFLAQAPLTVNKRENQLDVLEVIISGEHFAIEAKFVREASKLGAPTRLPCTPNFVLGLINFRGQILPLLDLREILELKQQVQNSNLMVVVVQSDKGQAGIAVDEIAGISSIAEADLQVPKQLVSPSLVPLFKGIRSDRLALLDVNALFSDRRLVVDSGPQGEP